MQKQLFILLISMIGISFCFTGCNNKKVMKAKQYPLEDFFKNPEKTAYQISPDGKYYSFMAPYEDRMNIFVQAVDQDSAIRLTSETDSDIAG